MRRLTTGILSEKCVVRRCRRCANFIQCTYTNLDIIAYYRYASLNDGDTFWEIFISCGFIHSLVCRSGPLDTLMIFTTTINVISIYRTSNVVMVSIIWLYMTVVVVMISFSIIVSCIFISLLLVMFGIMSVKIGNVIRHTVYLHRPR